VESTRIVTRIAITCFVIVLVVSDVRARDLELSMNGGLVTVLARDVPIKEILWEWERIGNTAFVNVEKLPDHRVTVEFRQAPETVVLRTLLRAAAGYVAAPRLGEFPGRSRFDRILILVASKSAPAATSRARRPATPVASVAPVAAGLPRQPPLAVTQSQSQLLQLQRVLEQADQEGQAPNQVAVTPVFGNIPSSRPGLPMGSSDQQERVVDVPTGEFGAIASVNRDPSSPLTPPR